MKKDNQHISFEFVETIPRQIEENVLYISIEFETATHLCACGCKEKVVTPLAPSGWSLIYNGTTVSLNPSIGNWSLKCQSHYFIKKNKIIWASQWNDEQIKATRKSRNIERDTTIDKTGIQKIKPKEKHQKNNWFVNIIMSLFKRD
ncbi:DUF6527 family protein [Sulfurovum mangrovi]|uniref:DUF6527 family protein n=1 Tax=Sulfurovum mangrovi TaxID=2893889 RepID=UPI001E385C71|nr:DUF6527 family protein [Sulfurovum mangrovi]UFH58341.1 hypothetical protein LN246_08265 [Sulfurovum mangrovi]